MGAIFFGPHVLAYLTLNTLLLVSGTLTRRKHALCATELHFGAVSLLCAPWALWLRFLDYRPGPTAALLLVGLVCFLVAGIGLGLRALFLQRVRGGRHPDYLVIPRTGIEHESLPAFFPALGGYRYLLVRRAAPNVPLALAP